MGSIIYGLVISIVSVLVFLLLEGTNLSYKKEEEHNTDPEIQDMSYNRLMSLGRMTTFIVLILLGLILVYNGIAEYFAWKKVLLP